MKKELLFFLAVVLLVAGCTGGGPSLGSGSIDQYHTGTKGIEMRFLDNAPPSRVYQGDSLDVAVELHNQGAFPESGRLKGKLEISGFDPGAITGSWDGGKNIPTSLEGRSEFNPMGGIEVMTFKARNVKVPFDADVYEPTILVHSCYEYKTIADIEVCVDSDPYEIVEEDKVCKPGNVGVSGGQGGPIAVTRVEQEPSNQNLLFRIYISNRGGGSAMLPRAYNDCPFDVEFTDLNKVTANVKLPHDASPDCSPSGTASDPIRLDSSGNGFIFCKFRESSLPSAYITSLNVDLDYVYSKSISTPVRIINVE